ncbi:TetR/AcrR family transcriptional regulator [Lacticaseibacillus rhamnosus]|uniref:TetR/AcrR family transcriptional regulator n=1 Tax=Lacticaseibacillus rhamnosus TaxID=47715 RepID=UPI001013CED9|nr:TetR/AcrR family transcriptional regulator [Lacticaseibacillus rhamnosus]RXS54059.1 TetR/AcrR family transcriptional regulator [Lacticaseibacillus rhamnosus]
MTAIPLPSPIIAQAVKLFAERGYAETNLPSIAKAAKVAVGTIYRHFKSKEDILNTAFTDIMNFFHDSLATAANCQPDDPETTFSRLFDAATASMEQYPTELHFIQQNVFNEALNAESRAARGRVITLINNMLLEGQERGVIVKADVRTQLAILYGSIVSMIDIVWAQQQLESHVSNQKPLAADLKNQVWNGLTSERRVFN